MTDVQPIVLTVPKPSCWPPQPGEVWTGQTARWLVGQSGTLTPLGHDAPWALAPQTAEQVWAADGPLTPPRGLAAALRREAHEVELRAADADAGVRAEAAALAETLRQRADEVTR